MLLIEVDLISNDAFVMQSMHTVSCASLYNLMSEIINFVDCSLLYTHASQDLHFILLHITVDCLPPSAVNGIVFEPYYSNTTEGARIYYSCGGHNRSITQCMSDGRWHPDPSAVTCHLGMLMIGINIDCVITE